MHDTKIGVVVLGDLAVWQKLNVTAFLAAGIGANHPDSIGDLHEDGSGNNYHSIFAQPVFVYSASSEHLQRTRTRALSRDVQVAIYIREMFTTDNDIDNRAAVKAVTDDKLDIVGIAFRAEKKTFDKIVNGLKLHS